MQSRSRSALCFLAVATVALGLATRRFPTAFPALAARFGGDALWAMVVYCLLAIVRPRAAPQWLALGALAVSVGVELSQLINWPWLQVLRASRLGALVLGQGFLWTDLASYTVGIALAYTLDRATLRLRRRSDGTTSVATQPRSER